VLSGHSETGVGNVRDMIWSLIKACIQMGVHPIDDYHLDVTPVDYVARAIVHIARDAGNHDRLFQLPHPDPPGYPEVYDHVRAYGYALEPLPFQEWVKRVVEAAQDDPTNALTVFAGVADNYEKFTERGRLEGVGGRIREIRFDGARTHAALAGSGIACPPLDAALVHRYLDYFVRIGFYPPPAGGRVEPPVAGPVVAGARAGG
jgi:hypothetical protein